MSLKLYKKKRDLKKSKEPAAKIGKKTEGPLQFVVQKHAATRLHYDFRLEMDGVLKSWAVPKGPSMNPVDKRLAIQVEDHPYEYKDFEGVIPEGYGAGVVLIWDQGTYTLEEQKEGLLEVTLRGKKLKGGFTLVKLRDKQWLLIKKKDRYASAEEITEKDRSVVSRKKIESFKNPRTKKLSRPLSKARPGKKRSTGLE